MFGEGERRSERKLWHLLGVPGLILALCDKWSLHLEISETREYL
jgi:hypothetical protein